jgi:MYXO-CTERM domain-containing protein
MNSLKNRLNKYAASAAAVTAAVAVSGPVSSANAAIVHSGVINQVIANTTNGLYVNVVTGQINEPGNGGGATVPGWDLNFWSSAGIGMFNPSQPAGGVYVSTAAATAANMAFGATVSGANTFSNNTSSSSAAATAQWNLNSDQNLVGFRFLNEGSGQVHYGWARLSFGSTVATRSLVEYAYESTAGGSIGAGVVPAPAAMALLGMGGLVAARRRRA